MSVIDDAIKRIQDLALKCTDIRTAPDLPIEDATSLPLVITHIREGEATAGDSTYAKCSWVVNVDFHFSRTQVRDAYKRIDTVVPEFVKYLAGDPTLNGKVDTIQFPVTFAVLPADWNGIITQMVSFRVPFKTLETPSTST